LKKKLRLRPAIVNYLVEERRLTHLTGRGGALPDEPLRPLRVHVRSTSSATQVAVGHTRLVDPARHTYPAFYAGSKILEPVGAYNA
jgi:hypothetical protein